MKRSLPGETMWVLAGTSSTEEIHAGLARKEAGQIARCAM